MDEQRARAGDYFAEHGGIFADFVGAGNGLVKLDAAVTFAADEVAKATEQLQAEIEGLRDQIPHPGDGSCDHCGKIPAVDIPTSLCDECRNGVNRAKAAEERVRELAARNDTLRKRLHVVERHNQWFERCESPWCNPSPDNDPASQPYGAALGRK